MRYLLILFLLFASPAWAGVDFDGIDDGLSCDGAGNTLDNLTAQTWSVWAYVDTLDATVRRLLVKDKAGSSTTLYTRIAVGDFSGTGDNIQFRVNNSAAGIFVNRISAQGTLTTGSWHHILVTWTGSTTGSTVKIYLNGAEVSYASTSNGSGSKWDDSADPFLIGNASTDIPFDGRVTEVAVWNVVLSADEIGLLSSSRTKRMPLQIRPSALRAYWPLDDHPDGTSGDGGSFWDSSGNGNTCTGNDGGNNAGLTAKAEEVLSYP
jgi:hypothetical protein